MSGADDLRKTAIEQAREHWLWKNEAIITDPAYRLAILNLIGDVREGNEVPWSDGSGETFIQFDEPGNGESVFVVRPRGEATDA